jgi:hypothetical protein
MKALKSSDRVNRLEKDLRFVWGGGGKSELKIQLNERLEVSTMKAVYGEAITIRDMLAKVSKASSDFLEHKKHLKTFATSPLKL